MKDKNFKGCGKIIFGDKANGTLNCGDDMGRYRKNKWVVIGKFKCKECEKIKSKQGENK